MLLQVRPPEPVDPPKSIVKVLQEPMDDGMPITTTGELSNEGATTLTSSDTIAFHKAHVMALRVAGHCARTKPASNFNCVPTMIADDDDGVRITVVASLLH